LSFDSDFDDVFGNFDFFTNGLTKRFRIEIDKILKEIKDGKLRGTMETREINEPGVKGYVIQGRFGLDDAFEPLEPFKPLKRRPLPEKPFEVSKDALEETREPLTDILEENDVTRIYVELPGEEEEDIHLNITEEGVEVKGKHFYKMIELSSVTLDKQRVSSKYKNGVLEITIPKQARLENKFAEQQREV
jgi:HSP20 family molecular chaperone IbpA